MTDKTQTTDLAPTPPAAGALTKPDYGIDVSRVIAMRAAVEEVVAKVLREGEHFGALPGLTVQEGKKPKKMLFQPGAEVLCQVFRLRPEFQELSVIERDDFISLKLKCTLFNSVTGEKVGEAIGSANSREDKYASQVAAKLCPLCGAPTIFKSKNPPPKDGWFCWAKKGGCGAEFASEDKKLLDQTGTVSIVRLYGLYHTLESIAQKRCYVKAVRNATATSDIFTDEDVPPDDGDDEHGQHGAPGTRPRGEQRPSAGPKATAVQVRDLNMALNELEIGLSQAAELKGRDREEALRIARLAWVNGMLASIGVGKPIASLMELTPTQADELIAKAKAGEMPGAK